MSALYVEFAALARSRSRVEPRFELCMSLEADLEVISIVNSSKYSDLSVESSWNVE